MVALQIKPIETVYRGYRFRSRLEARWAVFFDALGIRYEYEYEGWNMNGIWYLPDFWFPQFQAWGEVKGQEATEEEKEKCALLAEGTGKSVLLFSGGIPLPPMDTPAIYRFLPLFKEPRTYMWTECPFCHFLHIAENGILANLRCPCKRKEGYASPRLVEAYTVARQARFEHGVQG